MEIHQLRYFVAAMRLGSVKAAAKENFLTAPAVSIQLKLLEDELGAQLFYKSSLGLKPTSEGSLLLEHAEDILQRLSTLKTSLQRLKNHDSGLLKMGSIDAASIYLLPKLLQKFHKAHPSINITVKVAETAQLLNAVENNHIELAIVTLPIADNDLIATPIFTDTMFVVAHPEHALSFKKRVLLKELADGQLITYQRGSTTRQLIDQVFLKQQLNVRAAMEVSNPEAMKCLTEAGLGACILPERLISQALKQKTLKKLNVGNVQFLRTLGVVQQKDKPLSPPAQAFLKLLHSAFM